MLYVCKCMVVCFSHTHIFEFQVAVLLSILSSPTETELQNIFLHYHRMCDAQHFLHASPTKTELQIYFYKTINCCFVIHNISCLCSDPCSKSFLFKSIWLCQSRAMVFGWSYMWFTSSLCEKIIKLISSFFTFFLNLLHMAYYIQFPLNRGTLRA